MTRTCRLGLVAAGILAALCLPTMASALVVDRIVATVDGAPITLFELERFIRLNGTADPRSAAPEEREKALNALIAETLVRLESRRLGLSVSKQDVDMYIEEIKRGNGLDQKTLDQALEQQGYTSAGYRDRIAKDLLKNQLVARQIRQQIDISPAEVRKFYEENKSLFGKAGSVYLRQIFFVLSPTASEEAQRRVGAKAQTVVRELQSGASFSSVAKKYSEGPEAADGGSLGWMAKGQMIPQLEEVAFSVRPGEVGPPVRTGAGVHLLSVDEVKATEFVPLSEVEGKIQERLFAEAVQTRFDSFVESDLTEGHSIVRRPDPAKPGSQDPSSSTGQSSAADGNAEQAALSRRHAG